MSVFDQGRPGEYRTFAPLGLLLLACGAGVAVPVYIGEVGDGFSRLLALPALVGLSLFLAFSRKALLLAIILLRASADLLFDQTKLSIGGVQVGVGGLVNAFVIFIALLLVFEKPQSVAKKETTIAWAAFLLTAFIGVAISPAKVDAVKVYLALVSYLAVFVSAFYFVDSPRDFRTCVRIVVLSSLIPVLYAFVDIAMNWNRGGEEGFRLRSTFSHPNILACYLTLVIALVLYLAKSGSQRLPLMRQAPLIGYLCLLLALLVLTKTRSAWLACFVIFAGYAVFFERRYLLYLLVIAAGAFLVPQVRDRLLDLGSNNELVQFAKLNSFAWRKLIWESSLQWMQWDHYAFGYGLDSFRLLSPQFFPLAGNANPAAHNVYVQWLFEAGILGLLSLVWLFGRLAWWLKGLFTLDKVGAFIVFALLAEYLIVAFSDNMIFYLAFNWYFWFIVAAGCASVTAAGRREAVAREAAAQRARGIVWSAAKA